MIQKDEIISKIKELKPIYQTEGIEIDNQKKEVEELINDYKINAMKNFVPYEDGNDELKKWVNSLDDFNSEIDIPNVKTITAIKDARAEKNLLKIKDISYIENFSKQK